MLRAVIFLFCSFIITVAFPQTRKEKTPKNQVLFTVNKKPVTTDEFIYLYKKNHQNSDQDYTREKIEEYLSLYINFKLKVEEARRRGMDTTTAFRTEYNQYRDELRKPYLPGTTLTDSLVRMTYNRMQEEVRASHILVSLKSDATPEDTLRAYQRILELQSRLKAGEDFNRLASGFSEDPSARSNAGDLGYFSALQMVYPFESAAFSTKPGEVSAPFRTRFGYHILKVTDRRPSRGEVEVAHIVLRLGQSRSDEETKNLIFQIHDELRGGKKWEEACVEYSEDPGTRENGGKVRPFRQGTMPHVPEFERVAFELENPGDYSDPVQTQYGWHIVRLERKIPPAPFEEIATSLRSKVLRDERSKISSEELNRKTRKEFGFTEVAATKARIFGLADSTLTKGEWKPNVPAALMKQELFRLNGKPYPVSSFLKFAGQNQNVVSMDHAKYIMDLYNQFVDQSILTIQDANLVRSNPEYRYLVSEYYEGILLFEIMEEEVWNKASEDSLGQLRFFESRKDSFKAGERVRATLYSSSDKSRINGLADEVRAGDPDRIQQFVQSNKIKTESGYFKKGEKPVLADVPWGNGIYTVEHKGLFYLAWLKEVLPPGLMSFEEARPLLISDYQDDLEKRWIIRLKEKFPVKVNAKGRDLIFVELEKKKN